MADKRMINKKIIDSDAFLYLSHSAQMLYFHMNLNADDDGFLNNVNAIMSQTKTSQKDLDALIETGFILHVSKFVYVIAHWYLHNTIGKDRFHPTIYALEKSMLVRPSNVWTFAEGVNPYTEEKPVKPEKPKKEEPEKRGYGSQGNVMLTDEEYSKLCTDLGKKLTDKTIEDLSLYIGDPKYAKKYTDHNLAIRRWIRKNEQDNPKQKSFGDIADDYNQPQWDIEI